MSDTAHDRLCKLLRENAVFSSIGSTIGWDEQTQLPPAGTDLRADQSAMMAGLSHERNTSQALGDAIDAAEADTGDDLDKTAVARDARRDYDRATKLPADLVEAIARAEVVGHHAWVEARKNDDFKSFQPHLQTMLDLKRKEAECVGYDKDNGGHIYNALLDDYEPGETRDGIETVFNELKEELIELVGKVAESGKTPPREVLTKTFPVEAQNEFSRRAASAVGFDFDAGRLDIAVHPFCTGLGPGDTRMTTRFVENDLGNSFYSTLHETGHSMYEQGLPKKGHFGTALAQSISLGIHESQSRMWENLVGRSEAFWDWAWPVATELFPDALAGVLQKDMVFACNDIRPSFIRTESDEATYNLHVLLRFELEQALLTGELSVGDLPSAWDEKMQTYLGVTPPKISLGCLQDVHWSAGLIGYFPTYTLGNLYASQFFEQAEKDLGDLNAMFSRGEFAPLLGWLREKIHHQGRRYSARDLCRNITGGDLSAKPLLDHLKAKASKFYGV